MRFQGERLRAARKKKGLSQMTLSQKVGVSQNTISRWEREGADDMQTEDLRLMLKTLEVSEAYLRGQNDTTPTPVTASKRHEPPGIPAEENSDWQVNIEKSLAKAFDYDRHTLRDIDNVRAVLREAPFFFDVLDTDRAASVWLDACARLRAAGLPITGASLAVAMMALPTAHTPIPAASPHTSSPPAMESTGIKKAARRHG